MMHSDFQITSVHLLSIYNLLLPVYPNIIIGSYIYKLEMVEFCECEILLHFYKKDDII